MLRGTKQFIADLKKRLRTIVTLVFAVSLVMGLVACQSKPQSQPRRYKLKGKIVSVDKEAHRITVDHEEIPGFMSAMTMAYDVRDDRALPELAPGDQITAEVVVSEDRSWLENIIVLKKGAPSASTPSSRFHRPEPGEEVPDFVLVNQDGKRIRFRQYRGKAVLLTFIYTGCPLPEYCPLMTSNFLEINDGLRKNPPCYARTHLLSISIDPSHDTPSVLRRYGSNFTGDHGATTFNHWEFASAPAKELRAIATFFGLSYWNERGQIIHSMSTAIISPDGKVYRWYHDNRWKAADVLQELESSLAESET